MPLADKAARLAYQNKWARDNRDKTQLSQEAYRAAHPGAKRACTAARKARDPDAFRARQLAWAHANPEKQRASSKAWKTSNPSRITADAAKRRAAQLQATPAWADLVAIQRIYAESSRLTDETGIVHQVDHYYPLISTEVCGLHVEHNLQVLTAVANRRKSNRMPTEKTA